MSLKVFFLILKALFLFRLRHSQIVESCLADVPHRRGGFWKTFSGVVCGASTLQLVVIGEIYNMKV